MGKRIAIIGGTGKEGKGLAYRWAIAGHEIVIGSRQIEKAQIAADELNSLITSKVTSIVGFENAQAADWCEVVVLTVPYSAHVSMLEYLKELVKGKLFIDVTVPISPPKITVLHIPDGGSVGLEAKNVLGPETEVVTAFQNISYERLLNDEEIDCDVLVCGSSKIARERALELVQDAGMKGWDAGPLENSIIVEGMTCILIGINKKYGSKEAGIIITGVERG